MSKSFLAVVGSLRQEREGDMVCFASFTNGFLLSCGHTCTTFPLSLSSYPQWWFSKRCLGGYLSVPPWEPCCQGRGARVPRCTANQVNQTSRVDKGCQDCRDYVLVTNGEKSKPALRLRSPSNSLTQTSLFPPKQSPRLLGSLQTPSASSPEGLLRTKYPSK
jgi:hypothetical protein